MTFNKSATLEKLWTGSKTKRNRSKKKKKEVTGKYKIRLVRRVNEKIVDPPIRRCATGDNQITAFITLISVISIERLRTLS